MNKLAAVAVAALGLALVFPSTVTIAQDTTGSTSATTPIPGMPLTERSGWADVIADINAPGKSGANTDISAISDATVIKFVKLSGIRAGGDLALLEDAMTKNKAKLDDLHTAMTANVALSAHIAKAGHDVNDVVAISTDDAGDVIVFVDDV